jgi:hypothetical protein
MEKSRAELRAELERVLRQPIPQFVFDRFDRDDGAVDDYYERMLAPGKGEKENFKELKSIFEQHLEYLRRFVLWKAQSAKSLSDEDEDGPAIEPESAPSTYVTARASAISEFVAMVADARPDVTEFREKVLGGRLLSSEEAGAIVSAAEGEQDELQELGGRLANDYLGWDEREAMQYVLTGEAPRLRAIKIRGRGKFPAAYRPFQQSLTLSVLPWVPPKEVERVYRNIQRQVLEETSRETGTRILEVARFYWARLRSEGPIPSWPAWAERWNETHPDKKFPTWRHFREYLVRGARAALPRYKFPEPKPSAEKLQAMRAAEERIKDSLEEAAKNHRIFKRV